MSYQQKLSTPHGYSEFFHGYHANKNGKAPPIIQVRPFREFIVPVGSRGKAA